MTALESSHSDLKRLAANIVDAVLADSMGSIEITEASVHRPARSLVWVATFTGPDGGQIWRSTHLTDRAQALLVARRWEKEARGERARLGRTRQKPVL